MESEHTAMVQAIRTAIRKIANTYKIDAPTVVKCSVISVNKSSRSCSCKQISGKSSVTLNNVQLQADPSDGELKIPAVGSTVLVLTSTYNQSYIVQFSDLDEWKVTVGNAEIDVLSNKIQFGDGSYEGLVKVVELTQKINNLENQINDILHVLKTTSIPLAPSGTYPFAPLYTAILPIDPITNKTEIQNNKITHGNLT